MAGTTASGYKSVQMNLRENTIKQINRMQEEISASSRTDVVKTAVDIADMVINTIKEGGTVIIETANGNQSKIIIPGMKRI